MNKSLFIIALTLMAYTANAQEAIQTLCPDGNHPHMIDLGLPSGTKWACCNVDASQPEDYGGYYAWGETEEKEIYSWNTYIHCDGSSSTCHNLGSDIAGTKYDVAHVKWGGDWVMPSETQEYELKVNCTYTWTIENGVKGGKFTSKENGASIFLPAAGYRNGSRFSSIGGGGIYMSSTQHPSYSNYSHFLFFISGYNAVDMSYKGGRYYGLSVRPVTK